MGTPTLSYLVLLCKWSARKTENLEDRVRFSGEPQNIRPLLLNITKRMRLVRDFKVKKLDKGGEY